MTYPRVIIYADPDDMLLASRVAKRVGAPGYEWPKDGIAMVSFHSPGQQIWEGDNFSARRNKSGFTIYGPDRTNGAAA